MEAPVIYTVHVDGLLGGFVILVLSLLFLLDEFQITVELVDLLLSQVITVASILIDLRNQFLQLLLLLELPLLGRPVALEL